MNLESLRKKLITNYPMIHVRKGEPQPRGQAFKQFAACGAWFPIWGGYNREPDNEDLVKYKVCTKCLASKIAQADPELVKFAEFLNHRDETFIPELEAF